MSFKLYCPLKLILKISLFLKETLIQVSLTDSSYPLKSLFFGLFKSSKKLLL